MQSLLGLLKDINHFSLLLGSILLVMGFITLKLPPKKINLWYGYRTSRSMKNQENWIFAQKFATGEMIRGGWIMIIFALSGLIFPTSVLIDTLAGTTLMIILFVVLLVRTEKAIKQFEDSSDED